MESGWTEVSKTEHSFQGNGYTGRVWLIDETDRLDPDDITSQLWGANVSYPIPGTPSRGFVRLKSQREGGGFAFAAEAKHAVERWRRHA